MISVIGIIEPTKSTRVAMLIALMWRTSRGKKSISVILIPFSEWYRTAATRPSSRSRTNGFS